MTANATSAPASKSTAFAELVEQAIARVKAGDTVGLDELIRNHPDHADELQRLLPAVQVMADMSCSGERRGVSPTCADGDPLGELGDFRIIREVGRGGMGVVYQAEQISLGRRVALKVLPFAATMDPKQLQRFRNEAKAAASLHHEHVVPVYGVGCERGVHYYAMQFIDGTTLAQVVEEIKEELNHRGTEDTGKNRITAPLSSLCSLCLCGNKSSFFRHVAALIADAADALEYAHSVGIVHRDIKPANLLIDTASKVWIADFGLARFGPDAGLTMSGDLLGTLRYMAPEQALAKHGLADHRVDVYGLGATLYELLTGKPAVGGEDKQEILKRIAFEEPVALRKLDKAIPAELDTIALKCLAKEPKERYATAGELAADLRQFVEDKPITARRPTIRQRFGRWARRHPAVAAGLGLVAGLILAGVLAWGREVRHAETAARAIVMEAEQLRAADRLPEALQAVRRAADLLPRFGGDAALRLEIGEAVADLQLLNRFEEIKPEFATGGPGDRFDIRPASGMLRQAFQEYGVDVFGGDESAVVEALRRRRVAAAAAVALGDWAWHLPNDPAQPERGRLGRLAASLDTDPRQLIARVHAAAQAKDVNAIKALAAEAEAKLPPPMVVARIGSNLLIFSSFAQAERLSLAALERYPADFWINRTLALALVNMGSSRAAESVRFASVAMALRPRSVIAWNDLGWALRSAGRREEAAAALRRATVIKPDSAVAHAYLGATLDDLKLYAEAETVSRQAIALGPDFAFAQFTLGGVLLHRGRDAEAEEAFRQAVKLKPDFVEALNNLGGLLGQRGADEKAEESFRRAIQLRPEGVFSVCGLGTVLSHQGRHAEAEAEFHKALALQPNHAFAHINLAGEFYRQGKYAESLAACRRALELQREEPNILNNFAFLLATCPDSAIRDAPRAVQLAKKAVAYVPTNAKFHGGLGVAHFRAGNWKDAVAELEKSIELQKTGTSDDWFYLAMARWQLGDRQEAQRYYTLAAEWMEKNKPQDDDLRRLRAEAGDLLGIKTEPKGAPTGPPKE